MSNIETDDQEDKPLDPVMENVRRKMMRLQLVSGGIMLLMFMAVLAAIVYKINTRDGKPQTAATARAASRCRAMRRSGRRSRFPTALRFRPCRSPAGRSCSTG